MTQQVIHTLEPVYDSDSRILILGTLPSVKSRETGFYYGNPRNRFYEVLSRLLKCNTPQTIAQKKEMLLAHGIALFDVLHSCDIRGSADSSIKNPVPNDFSGIFKTAQISMVFANGKKAYELYQKYCFMTTGRECIPLPSTSPANAAASMPRLLEAWKQILAFVK